MEAARGGRLKPGMLVHELLQRSAAKHPDKVAVICGDTRITYGELESASNALARALGEAGVRRGDRVAIYLPNSIEAAVAIFGVLKAGAVFVPVNHGTKRDKLEYILNNCSAVGLITDNHGLRVMQELVEGVTSLSTWVSTVEVTEGAPGVRHIDFRDVMSARDVQPAPIPAIDQDLACLIYTSGSTGEPKGVVCGHNNVVFASGSIIDYLANRADDIVIAVVPFSFDYGLYQLLMTIRFGGTLVIENAFAYPVAILRTIERERVTGFPIVPTVASMILKLDLPPMDLSSLRYITNTAAALPETHISQLQERFPGVRIYSMYGMTECKRTLYLPPDRLDDKPASVGIAIPGTEVWVESEDGSLCAPGEVGELVVRGAHVMRGYWGDPELTNRYYRPGPTPGERVLYSNDLFRVDEEGLHYFVARKDDIIKSRGEKVAPKEIEAVLAEHPEIAEAAVIGTPDPVLGQAITAYIVTRKPQLAAREVKRHCSARLEPFMVPQHIRIVDDLPRTSNGKIDKQALTVME